VKRALCRRAAGAAAVFFAATITVPSAAQNTFEAPRTSYGHPDLTGIWEMRGTANWNLEGHSGFPGVEPSESVIVDPPDGRIPYTPEARARREATNSADDPHLKCFLAGVPRINYVPGPFRILQNASMAAIVYQDLHTYRLVPYDRAPIEGYEFWIGKSQGRWEDDALVVETISFTDSTWLDKAGNFHSADMRVTERYWLTGPNTMQYEARIDDSNVFTRPWSIRLAADRHPEPGTRIPEHGCLVDDRGNLYHVNAPESGGH